MIMEQAMVFVNRCEELINSIASSKNGWIDFIEDFERFKNDLHWFSEYFDGYMDGIRSSRRIDARDMRQLETMHQHIKELNMLTERSTVLNHLRLILNNKGDEL